MIEIDETGDEDIAESYDPLFKAVEFPYLLLAIFLFLVWSLASCPFKTLFAKPSLSKCKQVIKVDKPKRMRR